MTVVPLKGSGGSGRDLQPVAMRMSLVSSTCGLPSAAVTPTLPVPSIEPKPRT
jgi:hypothetical protein